MKKNYISMVLAILACAGSPFIQAASEADNFIRITKSLYDLKKGDQEFAQCFTEVQIRGFRRMFDSAQAPHVDISYDAFSPSDIEKLKGIIAWGKAEIARAKSQVAQKEKPRPVAAPNGAAANKFSETAISLNRDEFNLLVEWKCIPFRLQPEMLRILEFGERAIINPYGGEIAAHEWDVVKAGFKRAQKELAAPARTKAANNVAPEQKQRPLKSIIIVPEVFKILQGYPDCPTVLTAKDMQDLGKIPANSALRVPFTENLFALVVRAEKELSQRWEGRFQQLLQSCPAIRSIPADQSVRGAHVIMPYRETFDIVKDDLRMFLSENLLNKKIKEYSRSPVVTVGEPLFDNLPAIYVAQWKRIHEFVIRKNAEIDAGRRLQGKKQAKKKPMAINANSLAENQEKAKDPSELLLVDLKAYNIIKLSKDFQSIPKKITDFADAHFSSNPDSKLDMSNFSEVFPSSNLRRVVDAANKVVAGACAKAAIADMEASLDRSKAMVDAFSKKVTASLSEMKKNGDVQGDDGGQASQDDLIQEFSDVVYKSKSVKELTKVMRQEGFTKQTLHALPQEDLEAARKLAGKNPIVRELIVELMRRDKAIRPKAPAQSLAAAMLDESSDFDGGPAVSATPAETHEQKAARLGFETLRSTLSHNPNALTEDQWQQLKEDLLESRSGQQKEHFKKDFSKGQKKALYAHFPETTPVETVQPAKPAKVVTIPKAQQPRPHRASASKSKKPEEQSVQHAKSKSQSQQVRPNQLPANPAALLKDPRSVRVVGETHGSDFAQATAVRKAPAPEASTTNLVAERKADSPRPARVDAAVEHPKELLLRDRFILLDDKLFNGWSNRQKGVFTSGHHKGPLAKQDLEDNGRVFRDRGLTIPGQAPNGCYWIKPDEQGAMQARDSQFPTTFKPEQLRTFILSGCMNPAQHFDADIEEHVTDNGDTRLRYVFKVTQDLPNVNLMDRASSTITMKCVVDVTDMDKKVIVSAHPVDF